MINTGVNLKGERTLDLQESITDSAKVLRILLEYYWREKKVRFFILEKLFKEFKETQDKEIRDKH